MEEITKIVANKNKERKVLNKNDIMKICNIIKDKYKYAKDYKIVFEKYSPFNDGTYGITSNGMIVFYKDALELAQELTYNDLLDIGCIDGSKIDVFNFVTLDAIFHEFTHAAQFNIASNGRNNIESKLYNACNNLHSILDFYNDNYKNFITEINAYSRGRLKAYSEYSNMPEELITKRDKSIYASYALKTLKDKYHIDPKKEVIVSPAELLLENANYYNLQKFGINVDDLTKLIHGENNLTIYKKMTLGLPLTYMEYAYFILIACCVQSGEEFDFVKKLQKKI